MEGMRFTRNTQNTLYAFFGNIFGGKSYAATDVVVLRSHPIRFPDLKHVGAFFFEIEITCILDLLFLNRNKNSRNSPKRMHPE